MKQRQYPFLRLAALFTLSACLLCAQGLCEDTASASAETGTSGQQVDLSALFSDRDLDGSYDESSAVSIRLDGSSASCDSDAVSIDGTQIILLDEGVYILSGTLEDGQVVVNAGEEDKVQIVLQGAQINSSTSAAIYALEADKVFLTLAKDTENTLTNGGEYVDIDDNAIDAVVFSKTDLTLNGSGSLLVEATAGHGIVSKDDLVITGGTYVITAENHGLSAKDTLAVAGGLFTINAGKDAIHAENADDATLGTIAIADGLFTLNAQGDTISASGALQITGGTFDLITAGGSASVDLTSSTAFSFGGRGGMAQAQPSDTEDTSTSQKGIKAEGTMTITGGTFVADTVDDCLHSGGAMLITSGEFTLSSGDDAIHSDSAVTIADGTFTIPTCYEGIEGLSVTIEGGTYAITSYDDGINAAGGADSSGFGGRQQDQFASGSDSFILISGGTLTIVSSGDCIDSNGDLTLNGGVLDLTCNGSGNTALDTDGTYANNGADVTTNDGSENNPGSMGGGRRNATQRQRDLAPSGPSQAAP